MQWKCGGRDEEVGLTTLFLENIFLMVNAQ